MCNMLRFTVAVIATVSLWGTTVQAGYYGPTAFVEPDHWSVGSDGTTHQVWDDFDFSLDVTQGPDVWTTSPALVTEPSLVPSPPGYGPGEGRTYSFSGNYDMRAIIPNHTGGLPGVGTHVIVQTSTTTNEGIGVILESLRLADAADEVIAGGDITDALRTDVTRFESVNTPFGPSTLQQLIVEFYLPNYTDEFQIAWQQSIHTGFDVLRVDTMQHTEGYPVTVIPEPASLALLALAGCMALCRRQTRKIDA